MNTLFRKNKFAQFQIKIKFFKNHNQSCNWSRWQIVWTRYETTIFQTTVENLCLISHARRTNQFKTQRTKQQRQFKNRIYEVKRRAIEKTKRLKKKQSRKKNRAIIHLTRKIISQKIADSNSTIHWKKSTEQRLKSIIHSQRQQKSTQQFTDLYLNDSEHFIQIQQRTKKITTAIKREKQNLTNIWNKSYKFSIKSRKDVMTSKNKKQIKKNTTNSIELNAIQKCENNVNWKKHRFSDLLFTSKSELTHKITTISIFDRINIIMICVIIH